VTTTYDRLGRRLSIAQGTNTTDFTYNDASEVLTETYSAGVLASWQVNNVYDSLDRGVTNGVLYSGSWKAQSTSSYDASSRLAFISDGTNNATYAYLTNSSLISSIVFKSNTTVRLTTAKGYDNLYRLMVISNIPAADSGMTFGYQYNSANQRTAVTNTDGSRWMYGYDSLGQVTSGKKYWSDGIPVAGQQFEYSFDDIGNRKYAGSGGNEWGSGLHYQNYSVNNLNQYTQRTVPGAVDVTGAANSNATVTVNLQPTYRHGEYFRSDSRIDNKTYPNYQQLTTVGVLGNGTNADTVATNSGFALIPKTPEIYVYDADGNLATNGLWIFTWDGENRLVGLDSAPSIPDAAKKSLRFKYDSLGRRISKVVSNYNAGTWSNALFLRFVYDGWNLLAEADFNNAVLRSYVWGMDPNGTPEDLGGAGALLAVRDSSAGIPASYFYTYDGNANVRGLIAAKEAKVVADYEYSASGELIRGTKEVASANYVRFSTRYHDTECGFAAYRFRYLDAPIGRWISRDPLVDIAGPPSPFRKEVKSVYALLDNDAEDQIDRDGRGPAPSTGKGYLPVISYPGTGGCALTCCDGDEVEKGRHELRNRYLTALAVANFLHLKPAPVGKQGATCKNSSSDFITWLTPYPRCWICYLEERDYQPNDPNDQGYDHQVIICNAYNPLGELGRQVMFDWWGQTTWKKPYGDENPSSVTSGTFHSPNQAISPGQRVDCQGLTHGKGIAPTFSSCFP